MCGGGGDDGEWVEMVEFGSLGGGESMKVDEEAEEEEKVSEVDLVGRW